MNHLRIPAAFSFGQLIEVVEGLAMESQFQIGCSHSVESNLLTALQRTLCVDLSVPIYSIERGNFRLGQQLIVWPASRQNRLPLRNEQLKFSRIDGNRDGLLGERMKWRSRRRRRPEAVHGMRARAKQAMSGHCPWRAAPL